MTSNGHDADDDVPWLKEGEEPTDTAALEAEPDLQLEFDSHEDETTPESLYNTHDINQLDDMIVRGREGGSIWIPMQSLPRVGNVIEIAQSQYYLIGGASGTGKTSFAHQQFILGPYLWYMKNKEETDIKLEIIVRNMERPTRMLIAKWACLYLLSKYNICVDVRFIIGRGQQRSKVSDELYEKIVEALVFFDEMMDVVKIISKQENPTGLWNHAKEIGEANGKIVQHNKYESSYVPNDPNKIVLVLVDHIGRIRSEQGFNDVQNLRKMSEYLSLMRDYYHFSPVVVCQFNRGIQDTSRRTTKAINLTPEERHFKGASNMYEDCDVAMALFNPWKYQVEQLLDYQIGAMISREGINRFRSLHVLKNSWGTDDFSTGLQFVGEVGAFNQMPLPQNMNAQQYEQLSNPKYIRP